MIAADTCVLIDYFKGIDNQHTQQVNEALLYHSLVVPPVVLAELFSNPHLSEEFIVSMNELPILEIMDGYWMRAALNRSILMKKKLKARLADTLIAQSCIDHQLPLITLDGDFKHFSKYCGLKLF